MICVAIIRAFVHSLVYFYFILLEHNLRITKIKPANPFTETKCKVATRLLAMTQMKGNDITAKHLPDKKMYKFLVILFVFSWKVYEFPSVLQGYYHIS